MSSTILIVEDEEDLSAVLAYNLQSEGFITERARSAEQAWQLLQQDSPDLVLLDLMLPGAPGTDLCRRLKADPSTRQIPVVMLTARGAEEDRVRGLELGADDYVAKPFSVRELLLRVKAILRRGGERPRPAPEVLRAGRLEMDLGRHQVLVDGREVALTPVEFRLLRVLLERRGYVQSRATLLDDAWGVNAAVSNRTVDTHVRRLREKLGPVADDIETLRGVGYRFREDRNVEASS